ncbi:asparagine synthase (glutamine-hydrolyzing) [Candidatus Woesearchaeota archaeon]|nr:asparagine synthase (glutamine-hydrolyzing) [Candidatus Woesearchaeota archaeon]
MCGIVGFNWDDKETLTKMASMLKHRGPDQNGFYTDSKASLGHQRLSILDLSEKGRQPMSNADGSILITYNGEVYNFQEIREELEKKGYRFASNTDTEVIIYAYQEYGTKCTQLFNGMFAFCIYDKNKNQFFLARDRVGIKPLYYYYKDGKFIFASELKSIIQHSFIERKVDEEAIRNYITYGCIYAPRTIFQDIYKLEPGCQMIVSKDGIKVERYWDIDYSEKYKDKPESFYTEMIIKLLDESVSRRLIADVPVGAFLSGGVDSSAVVASIKKYKDDLKTFSIKFDYDDFNESKWAHQMAAHLETDHYEIGFDAEEVLKLIPTLSYLYDEPYADSSMIPTYLVSKVARKHVTVSLSGDGGDEVFNGYNRYLWNKQITLRKMIPTPLMDFGVKPAAMLLSKLPNPFIYKVSKHLDELTHSNAERYSQIISFEDKKTREEVSLVGMHYYYDLYKKRFIYPSIIDNMSNADFHMYLPDDILTKVDRASMGVSLEARVPILDHTFLEFTSKIPPGLKLNGNEGKYIFKKALLGRVPKNILYRKKQGFAVPLVYYFRKELAGYIEDELLAKDFSAKQYLNQDKIRKLIELHKAGKENYSAPLWAFLMLEKFLDRWVSQVA